MQKGFTLVEIILVFVIIAIVSSIGTMVFTSVVGSQQAAAVRSDARIVVEAVNSFNVLLPNSSTHRIDGFGDLSFDAVGRLDLNTDGTDALISQDLTVAINPDNISTVTYWIGLEPDTDNPGFVIFVLLDTPNYP